MLSLIKTITPTRSDLFTLLASFMAMSLLMVNIHVAQAQEMVGLVSPSVPGFFASLPAWQQAAVGVLGGLSALATSLSFILGLLGSYYSPALKAAAWCSKFGLEAHQLGAWIGSLLGGGRASPNAAMAPANEANKG